jgi:predicted RNase H-like HicB family nuclease
MDIPLKVIVHAEPERGYWAEVPGMPGCLTEGDTVEELHANIRDALEGWLGATQDDAIERWR